MDIVYIPSLNLIVEVKSSYFYYAHYEINIAKRKATILSGYKFVLILNKKYNEFNKKYIK